MKQVTLGLLKADKFSVKHAILTELNTVYLPQRNLLMINKAELQWSRKDAERFYVDHRGKFFYQRLISFMTSGPMVAFILLGQNAVADWRELIGPTRIEIARSTAPHSLRAKYAFSDTRNAFHGSDSIATAKREISLVFPDFDFTKDTSIYK